MGTLNSTISNLLGATSISNSGTGVLGSNTGTIVAIPVNTATGDTTLTSVSAPSDTVTLTRDLERIAQLRAEEIVREQQQATIIQRSGRVFTKFDPVNDIVSSQTEIVTAGVWSDGISSLTTYFTSSELTNKQTEYYQNVYHKDPYASGSAVQFSIAYGNAYGSGSDSGGTEDAPSKAIYSQYKQLLLEAGATGFSNDSGSFNSIYVINFSRARIREVLDPGNFEIPLRRIDSAPAIATGSYTLNASTVFTLIDDSGDSGTPTMTSAGRVYNLVSGSIANGVYNTSAPVYYGSVFPDHGVIVFDGRALDSTLGFSTNTGSNVGAKNHYRLFHSISGSAQLINSASGDVYGFLARNAETISSTHYFVRVKNAEYNYTNNPSWVTGSYGQFKYSTFVNDPKTYITTIGLYNEQQELLAVAKLSKPVLKSFTRDLTFRVKLDH